MEGGAVIANEIMALWDKINKQQAEIDKLKKLAKEHEPLGRFYQVDTYKDLVDKQEDHITRLQALVSMPTKFPSIPREG